MGVITSLLELNMTYDRCDISNIGGEKMADLVNNWGNLISICKKKIKLNPSLTPYSKINSK